MAAKSKKLTRQEIFNKIRKHLLKQKKRAGSSTGGCRYRTTCKGKVLRCAVGCLIPDRLYQKSFEGVSVWNEYTQAELKGQKEIQAVLRKLGVSARSFGFLRDLQKIHDDISPKEWESALETFRISHKLKA